MTEKLPYTKGVGPSGAAGPSPPKSRTHLLSSAAFKGRMVSTGTFCFDPIQTSSERRRRRMKHMRMIGVALAAALCGAQADAQELTGTLKNVKETGAITLGFRDSSIPFSYLDDSQKPIGFAMDICYH